MGVGVQAVDYNVGRIGRVIVARGIDGEDVYEQIESIASAEGIRCAAVLVVGGLRRGKVVVGPKNPTGPIEPQYAEFDDAREIAGVGTIFPDDGKPTLHLHGAIGRGKETLGEPLSVVQEATRRTTANAKDDRDDVSSFTPHPVPNTLHSAFCTLHSALCTLHSRSSTESLPT